MTKEDLYRAYEIQRKRNQDWPALKTHIGAALDAAEKVFEEGTTTHEPMDWKALGVHGNIDRANVHLGKISYVDGSNFIESDEDELLHAMMRLACAWCCRTIRKTD